MFHYRAEISYNNNPSRCSPPAIVSSSEMDCTKAEIEKKRGVKRGSQRGPYSKAAKNDTKLRIIAAAEKDSDWKAAARANGAPIERMKLPRNAGDTNKIKIK